ncbi:Glycolate oxidase subunit GlcD [Saliniradius amylolyticus]|uniref:D-lactate dehydrogenase (cytochrome) n=1 Tax=Saliniradius amylolyticus TaxID=2183582 RepID=A0A2S2E615_9ALTE|nr:FAD-binding and (Fe-S)-binding domain-containing protein [Saliniradius amylolyticus]AWL13105.1 Glycolate oxidase subunit GlcD [Saliniradius amylolyticus]
MSVTISPKMQQFKRNLLQKLGESAVISDLPRRLAYSTDASFYHLLPQLVVTLSNVEQVQWLIEQAAKAEIALTFRAAGTSLSGQAVTDSVLVMLDRHWRQWEILESGSKIRLQPGVIGAQANRALAPLGRKIGPDPASINACKVGGIAANNASGMCCGVKQNSYHTLSDMTVVLADGTVLDTSNAESLAGFRQSHRTMLSELSALRERLLADPELTERVRYKYRLKNTTGYGINALLDYEDPVDILAHLMIGSEGTLGFIADITYHTVEQPQHRATGLFVFADIQSCCERVTQLAGLSVNAVELLDARALRSVSDKPGMPDIQALTDRGAALLIEVGGADESTLLERQQQVQQCLSQAEDMIAEVSFSRDAEVAEQLWAIRKGTFPAVGAVREVGTTVIIEDVAFDVARLAEGVAALHELFDQFGYHEAIIFGHALEGNLHFVFTQAFDTQTQVEQYRDFMQAVSELVVGRFDGSLKAEHGTGRNMAPFVRHEWGDKAYQLMQQIKALLDPKGILNPGVVLNDDPEAHLKHLKSMPETDGLIDHCIECGFCEPVCPSKDLTLTPRQRIALKRRSKSYSGEDRQILEQAYQYLGVDTCAATGLCAERCPVDINTGDYIKALRAKTTSSKARPLARWAAGHLKETTAIARFGLNTLGWVRDRIGDNNTDKVFNAVSRPLGGPTWSPAWPKGAKRVSSVNAGSTQTSKAIYIPSCPNRIFGAAPGGPDERSLPEVVQSLFDKAGWQVIIPNNVDQLCCGMPFASKGQPALARQKKQELLAALGEGADIPVLIDASPCALQLQDVDAPRRIYETAEFMVRFLLPHLTLTPVEETVALHVTCSSQRLHNGHYLEQLARACAKEVVIPEDIHCCGFAGDKGFFTPELNASALTGLKAQLPTSASYGISNSRTCEIGLQQHGALPYQSVLYLLDRVCHPRTSG